MKTILICLGIYYVLLVSAAGQTFDATLSGRVIDPANTAVPKVRIEVTNTDNSKTLTIYSNEVGFYIAAGLPPGTYKVTAEHPSFKKLVRDGITLQLDQNAHLDLALTIGAVTESVVVTDTPPMLNSETGAKGQVIDNGEIMDLPLNGRDFTELAYLTPGVVSLPEGVSNSGTTAINGGRSDGVNYLVNGLVNRSVHSGGAITQPSVDAVQEFKVQTSAYAADYGSVGSGVMNVVLKSGTNQLHGTIYEFTRNSAMDARNFFDTTKSDLSRNQYGGTIGGPVVLPRKIFGPAAYNGKDRSFFFFSFEGLQSQTADALLARVPTLSDQAGDFSSLLQGLKPTYLRDPAASGDCSATHQEDCFPGNIIPSNRFDPIAVKLLKLFPLPNRTGSNNYQSSDTDTSSNHNYIIKLDHQIGERVKLALSYISNNSSSYNPYAARLPGFGLSSIGHNKLAGIRSAQVITPGMTNEFRLAISRVASGGDWRRPAIPEVADAMEVLSISKDPTYEGLPRVSVSGYDVIGHHGSYPSTINVTNYQFFDVLSMVRGRHFLRMGADMVYTQYYQYYPNNGRGFISFVGRVTGGTATPVPFADFLLGLPDNASVLLDARNNYLLYKTVAGFLQDDFKVTPSLTLNLGLRYDLLLPPVEKYNRFSNFVPEL